MGIRINPNTGAMESVDEEGNLMAPVVTQPPLVGGNPQGATSVGFNPEQLAQLGAMFGGKGGGTGLGWNTPTVSAGLEGIGQLGGLYLGIKQLGLAKDSFKFQKQAYAKNLANQTASYNTQMRDRVAGRNYATEEERRAAEAAALLPG